MEKCWPVQWIQSDPKTIIEQLRNDPRKQRTPDLQTRVRIALNQKDLERLVDHEVVAEHLERIALPQRVDLRADGPEAVGDQPLHARKEVPHEAHGLVLVAAVQEPLEVVDAELVGVLEAAVVVGVGLHGVVGEVHKAVGQVLEVEGLAAGAEVDVAVHVAPEDAVGRGEHCEGAHIELAAVNEEWFVNVLLHNG